MTFPKIVILIKHQILSTNLRGNVSQLKGRIINQILGVKGLSGGSQMSLKLNNSLENTTGEGEAHFLQII